MANKSKNDASGDEELQALNMTITLRYSVIDLEESLGLFEDGLREAMNKTASEYGLQFQKLSVDIEED